MTSSVVFPKTTETVVALTNLTNRIRWNRLEQTSLSSLPCFESAQTPRSGRSWSCLRWLEHRASPVRGTWTRWTPQVCRWIHRQTDSRQISLQIRVTSKQNWTFLHHQSYQMPEFGFFSLWTQYDSVQGVVRFEFARRLHLQMASHQSRFCKHQSRQLDFLTTQSRAAKNIMSMSITIWNSWPNTTIC